MKTPREILLERHRAAGPKLDALRENVLATELSRAERAPLAVVLWRELVLPCRAIWGGLAAVWVAILALHCASGPLPELAGNQTSASRSGAAMALREQKQILAELLGPAAPKAETEPAHTGPRGALRALIRFA